jgi:hypothetical protein
MKGFVGFAHEGSLRFVVQSGKEANNDGACRIPGGRSFGRRCVPRRGDVSGRYGSGASDVREQYHPLYYSAFVADPD